MGRHDVSADISVKYCRAAEGMIRAIVIVTGTDGTEAYVSYRMPNHVSYAEFRKVSASVP